MYKSLRFMLSSFFLFMSVLLVGCNNSPVSFEINFDSNGGTEVSSIITDGGSTITLPDDPTKDGYSFAGWYWDNNTFSNQFTVNSLLDTPISSNLMVYAKWEINQNSVEYVDWDGTVLQTADYDLGADLSSVTAPVDPSREGYIFSGWDTTVPATMGTTKVTITATYTEIMRISLASVEDFLLNFEISYKQVYTPPSGASTVGTIEVIMTITKKSDFILNGSYQLNLVYFAVNNNTYTRNYYEFMSSESKYTLSFNIYNFDESLSYSFTTNFETMMYTGTTEDGFTKVPIFYDFVTRLS